MCHCRSNFLFLLHHMKSNPSTSTLAIIALIAFAAVSRFIPHPANFTAIGAIALFGAARMQQRWLGLSISLLAMLISDAFMPFGYNPWVYASFLAIGVLGFSLRNTNKTGAILGVSVLSSLIFFAISNFGVWASAALYPTTFEGLVMCYTAAIPFFWNTLAADLFFNSILFGAYAWIGSRYLVSKKA